MSTSRLVSVAVLGGFAGAAAFGQVSELRRGEPRAGVERTRVFPPPVIDGHEPDVIQNGHVITVFGDHFPLDPMDVHVELVLPEQLILHAPSLEVVDTDGDGAAEVIHAIVRGLRASEFGAPFELRVWTGSGSLAVDENGIFAGRSFTHGEDDVVYSPLVSVSQEVKEDSPDCGRAESDWERDLDGDPDNGVLGGWKFCFDDVEWRPNSTYKISGDVAFRFFYDKNVQYNDDCTVDDGDDGSGDGDGSDGGDGDGDGDDDEPDLRPAHVHLKPLDHEDALEITITTGDEPTTEECAAAIAGLFNEVLEALETDSGNGGRDRANQAAKCNFEVVAEDGCVIVRVKDGAPDPSIRPERREDDGIDWKIQEDDDGSD